MSTLVPELPAEQQSSFADDFAGMFSFYIDPPGAARRVHHKWFWVGPLILISVVSIITGIMRIPVVEHAMESMQMPGTATPEQLATIMKWQRILVWIAPLGAALVYAFDALILFATASVLTVKGSYRSYFNLVAGLSLISMLALIAGTVVLKTKEVTTMAELQPALGLDIFMPEGSNKYLSAFLGYFSVFELWWIVMAVLIMSYAFRLTKGKAFMVVLPLCLLGLIFRVVMAGLQRT
jgi:hypothetical protein